MSFPLTLSEFFDHLPVAQVTFRLGRAVTFSETGGGEVIDHKIGARLWQGEITLDRDYHARMAGIEALISLVEEGGGSFMLRDPRYWGPAGDPFGQVLGAASVTIDAITGDGKFVDLAGLPQGYVLSAGDYLGFSYGANPTRHALHRVVGTYTAGASVMAGIRVVPAIRDGAQPGAAVELVTPACKVRLVEADYGSGRSVISAGGTLSFTQTLR